MRIKFRLLLFFVFAPEIYLIVAGRIEGATLFSFLSEHLHQLSVLTIWMNYLVFTQFNHLLLPAKDYDHVLSACVRHVVGPAQSTPHTVTVLAFGDEQDQEKIFVAVPERGNKAIDNCLSYSMRDETEEGHLNKITEFLPFLRQRVDLCVSLEGCWSEIRE